MTTNTNKSSRDRSSNNTKRPPRWEREGDNLYAEVTKQLDAYNKINGDGDEGDNHLLALTKERVESAKDVCRLLKPWMVTEDELREASRDGKHKKNVQSNEESSTSQAKAEDTPAPVKKKPPPFLWGTLPVGPVLASRLNASNRPEPTSVQKSAFQILTASQSKNNKSKPTKRTNAIIASPTGTGKTLAYLLPLLCTSPGGQSGEGTGGVLIVTPTIEIYFGLRLMMVHNLRHCLL